MPLRFPFVFSWPHSSFLFSPETYYIVWRYLSLFIRSPPKEHLGCFQFVVTMNKAAMNTCEQVLCAYNISVHVGKYPGVPVLGHLVRGRLVAKKPPTVLPGGGGGGAMLHSHSSESSSCSLSLPAFGAVSVWNLSRSGGCVVRVSSLV